MSHQLEFCSIFLIQVNQVQRIEQRITFTFAIRNCVAKFFNGTRGMLVGIQLDSKETSDSRFQGDKA